MTKYVELNLGVCDETNGGDGGGTFEQVPAAVEALGGAADSLDPLTLLMASGGDGGSSWQRSEMDGITIRLQVSNGIPIQVRLGLKCGGWRVEIFI